MFDRIAPVYDVMNRVDDGGARPALASARGRARSCGPATACSTPAAARATSRSRPSGAGEGGRARLLRADARARAAKSGTIEWVQGDALALPFADGEFDAVTVGFGVRNLDDLEGGLRELRRVLRPGGKVAVLEITRPRGLLRPFFRLWFDVLVPFAGRVLPGGEGVHVPPRERPPLPGARGSRGALRSAPASSTCATGCSAAGASRCTRRVPHDGARGALSAPRRGQPYLDGARAASSSSRSSGTRGSSPRSGRRGRRGRQAAAARARVPSPRRERRAAVRGGVAVELAHVATLVHDDLIDGAELRRGQSSAWHEHGEGARGGGRLSLRARLRRARRVPAISRGVDILARACLALARGEAMQQRQRARSRRRRSTPTSSDIAQDRKALRGFVPARLARWTPRGVRARARDRVPDRGRHPRLRPARRSRPGRSRARTCATGRRPCRSSSPRARTMSSGARSQAGRWRARSSASPRDERARPVQGAGPRLR